VFEFTSEDLLDMGEIGRGAFGTVNKMVHKRTNTVMAVKRIRSTVDEKDQKQLLMDLAVVMKTKCPYIVQFYGALFKEVSCMRRMLENMLKHFSLLFRETVGFAWN
jgi:mitogen-activated protein kinase kinase 4